MTLFAFVWLILTQSQSENRAMVEEFDSLCWVQKENLFCNLEISNQPSKLKRKAIGRDRIYEICARPAEDEHPLDPPPHLEPLL